MQILVNIQKHPNPHLNICKYAKTPKLLIQILVNIKKKKSSQIIMQLFVNIQKHPKSSCKYL